jgi:hypothetical protein
MKKITTKKITAGVLTLGVLGLFAFPTIVGAVSAIPQPDDLGLGSATLTGMITGIIQVILGFLGVIAVLIILWGGFIWMTAGGEPDKVEKAKKMIYAGIIGLVIIFAAYAISTFVIARLTTLTGATIAP